MDQPVETWTVRVDADTSDLQDKLTAAGNSGRQFSRALTTAFQGVAIQGKSVTDTLSTLALGLSQFRSLHHVEWNLTLAASLLVTAPIIVIFFLAQRVFLEGVTLTGVKG